jgi:hypothetical protein
MSNADQFPEVAKVCKDFRAIGAKVLYVRNAKGEEKGKEVKLILGENLLSHLKK